MVDLVPLDADLPALSPVDVAQIEADTGAALRALLAQDAVSPSTVAAYTSALRYWDAWHRAATGRILPLLETPRRAVPPAVVLAFIAHHTPTEDAGRLRLSMPPLVMQRMVQIQAVGKRRVAARDDHAEAAVPTLATIRHRLAALAACHRLAGLVPDWPDDPQVRQALRALGNRVSRSAPAMLRQPKREITRELFEAMLHDCLSDGLMGLRDAAMLHVAFHTGGRRRSELVQMRWRDLSPLREGDVSGWLWQLREVKGKRRDRADQGAMLIPIIGPAADALDRWRDVLLAHRPDADVVWWRIIHRDGAPWPSTPMIGADVWAMVRRRIARIGLDPDDFGAHSLRSGGATTFLREGGALADAAAMLGHAKLDTTRHFYDRRGVPVEAVARLVARHRGR
jgi:integrase